MKALIASPDKLLRNMIRTSINWPEAGIGSVREAEDELSALDLMDRDRPELLLLDWSIAGTDGPELLGRLQASAPFSKIIVLTDFNDTHQLRQAIKWGVSDLLLKPPELYQLQDAVLAAADQWRRDEQIREKERTRSLEVDRLKPLYLDKLLSDLLSDSVGFGLIREQLERELPSLQNAEACRVAILSLDTISRSVRAKYALHPDLLFFSLLDICNAYLIPVDIGIAFRPRNSDKEIVLLLWDNLEHAVILLSRILQSISRTIQTRSDFGLGDAVSHPHRLHQSYNQASQALRRRNLLDEGGWIHKYDGDERPYPNKVHFADFEEDIRLALRSGETDKIRASVDAFLQEVGRLERITVDQVELWRHEYNVIKERWLRYFFHDGLPPELKLPSESSTFLVPLDEQGKLSIELWRSELTESLLRLAGRLKKRRNKGGGTMPQIEAYLNRHYDRQLTLQDVADRFYLSREYISRKFKQHFGENLVEYLCRIRMDKARALLANPQLKITEIARMVGYPDEKYFSKVFKKQTGMSPNAFRKMSKPR
ncbi:helix-turn-helix domain-containing protein [Paenibacillus sp. GYB004]|uniref:response regulator transcription factor n=1 Tax=Paenibacillus sp. GYB004 TaxID=2994393 RepID=UPI002F96689B